MTEKQEAKAKALCKNHNAEYDPKTWQPSFSLPSTWVMGWAGSVMYGIDPEGNASS